MVAGLVPGSYKSGMSRSFERSLTRKETLLLLGGLGQLSAHLKAINQYTDELRDQIFSVRVGPTESPRTAKYGRLLGIEHDRGQPIRVRILLKATTEEHTTAFDADMTKLFATETHFGLKDTVSRLLFLWDGQLPVEHWPTTPLFPPPVRAPVVAWEGEGATRRPCYMQSIHTSTLDFNIALAHIYLRQQELAELRRQKEEQKK